MGINGGTSQALGFGATINNLALALIEPADTTDPRSWVTLQANLSNVGLVAPSGFPVTMNATALSVDVNTTATDGTYLNYATLPSGTGLTVPTGPSTSVTLNDTEPNVEVAGTVNLGVAGFLQLTGVSMALQDTVLASVTVTDGTNTTTLTNAPLLTIGSAGGSGFAGFNYGTPQAIGVNLDVNSLALALIEPADATDTRDWVSLSASIASTGLVVPSGFPVTFTASSLNLNVNTEASDGTYVDFSQFTGGGLSVATGPSETESLTDTQPLTEISGTVNLSVGGFLQVTNGSFALQKKTIPTLSVTNGTTSTTLTNPNLLTFGLNGGSAFAGINGGTANAIGFGGTISSLAVAVVQPASTSDSRTWVTVDGQLSNVGTQAPSGFPVTFNAATLNVDLNLKASDGTYANYATQPNQGLTVQTGR